VTAVASGEQEWSRTRGGRTVSFHERGRHRHVELRDVAAESCADQAEPLMAETLSLHPCLLFDPELIPPEAAQTIMVHELAHPGVVRLERRVARAVRAGCRSDLERVRPPADDRRAGLPRARVPLGAAV
jgi:hypothetical protein